MRMNRGLLYSHCQVDDDAVGAANGMTLIGMNTPLAGGCEMAVIDQVSPRTDKDGSANDEAEVIEIVRKALQERGFRLDYDEEYDQHYNLKFIVTRIRSIHAHVNLGVQITVDSDNLDTQRKFLEGSRRGVVHKAIYVELDSSNVETGAIPVAISACMSFLFDRRYSHFKCIGLRVFEDCTFHFFDVEENARRLSRHVADSQSHIGQDMSGNIIAYFTDKGFGFIESEDDQKFFFHIANVVDDELRLQLPAYVPGDVLPVMFKYGGSDGKKYPKAVEVVLESNFERDDFEDNF